MRKTFQVAVTAVIAAVLVTFGGGVGAAHASMQSDVVTAVNGQRGSALIWDGTLASAAQSHADRMTGANHSGYSRSGWIVAENVAWAPGSDAWAVVAAWAASPGHAANMRGTQYTHAGAGYSPNGGWVLIVGAPVPVAAPAPPPVVNNPAPVAPPAQNSDDDVVQAAPPPPPAAAPAAPTPTRPSTRPSTGSSTGGTSSTPSTSGGSTASKPGTSTGSSTKSSSSSSSKPGTSTSSKPKSSSSSSSSKPKSDSTKPKSDDSKGTSKNEPTRTDETAVDEGSVSDDAISGELDESGYPTSWSSYDPGEGDRYLVERSADAEVELASSKSVTPVEGGLGGLLLSLVLAGLIAFPARKILRLGKIGL